MASKFRIINLLLILLVGLGLLSCTNNIDNNDYENEAVFFQLLDGKYFSARRDQNNIVIVNSFAPNDWETFYVEKGKKNTVNIKTKDGLYLGFNNTDSILYALPKHLSQKDIFILKPFKEFYKITTINGGNLVLNKDLTLKVSQDNSFSIFKVSTQSQFIEPIQHLGDIDFFRFFIQFFSFIVIILFVFHFIKHKSSIKKFSLFTLLIIGFVWGYVIFHAKNWESNHVINHDVIIYYEYLPAAIVFNDLSFEFIKDFPQDFNGTIWLNDKEKETSKVPKFTMGMAFMYLPFFLIGHLLAHIFDYTAYGYSLPYFILICISSWFYAFLGLFYLRKILLKHYNDVVVGFTLISIAFATNLFYYVTQETAMSHAYSFCLFSVFIWKTISWHNQKTFKTAITLGLLMGLITLIRPTNVLLAFVFILYNVTSFKLLKDKVALFLQYKNQIFTIIICTIIIWIPQFVFWKSLTGHWFFNSYGKEGFYFSNPKILDGLFSYRKGWLVYTPLMLFAILGITFLFKERNKWAVPILFFLILNVYVVFSWWCWWYGGSFGSRPMIDSYALLAIPLASFFSYFDKKTSYLRSVSLFIIFLTVVLNLFQTLQTKSCLHYDGMTKEAYWSNFTRLEWNPDYEKLIKSPDYDKALNGKE